MARRPATTSTKPAPAPRKSARPARPAQRKPARPGPYAVHPGVEMVQGWIQSLPVKTGRTLEQWIALIRKDGPKDQKARSAWLKKEHGFGGNTASWLADRASAQPGATWDDDPETYLKMAGEYVEAMYAGPKSALRPLYDRLLELALAAGPEAKACPCKTIVPIYRNHVFAQLKPTTRTRIDLGLALAKHTGKLPARLIDTGGLAKKDRITHRIEITSMEDIDVGVEKWLKVAYDLDG